MTKIGKKKHRWLVQWLKVIFKRERTVKNNSEVLGTYTLLSDDKDAVLDCRGRKDPKNNQTQVTEREILKSQRRWIRRRNYLVIRLILHRKREGGCQKGRYETKKGSTEYLEGYSKKFNGHR